MQVENVAKATILERFRNTQERILAQQLPENSNEKKKQKLEISDEDTELPAKKRKRSEEAIEAQGLSALPQPEVSSEETQKPALKWPVEPQFISPDSPESTRTFEELGLSKFMCARLKSMGMKKSFAVQTAVIPELLKDQRQLSPDPLPPILVNSFTGSGKTLAYAVPIVELLHTRRVPRLRALIVLPTKTLISQVLNVLDQLSKGTKVRAMSLSNKRSLKQEANLLRKECPDILVAAPGRLVEQLAMIPDLLDHLEMLVIDEADRLLGQNFQNWTAVLETKLPMPRRPRTTSPQKAASKAVAKAAALAVAKLGAEAVHEVTSSAIWSRPPQRLVFSATLTRDPAKMAALQIQLVKPMIPKLFVIGQKQLDGNDEFNLPAQLRERLIGAPSLADKPLVLVHELINSKEVGSGRVIVFVRSNESAARLARLISLIASIAYHQTVEAQRCSGEMKPQARKKVMQKFAQEPSGILVCTDMIARGIDMEVDLVINYDVPSGSREYVHRVGRTARAGAEGHAWTIVTSGADRKQFWSVQEGISRSSKIVEENVVPEVNMAKYEEALKELANEVLDR